jgi:hypothetical protein
LTSRDAPEGLESSASRLVLVTYVFAFDHKHRRAPMDMKDLLGGKGANLAEMTSVLGLPVPAGFTITTDACRAYMHGGWPSGLTDEVAKHVAKLEKKMGRTLGDPSDPLLVSVRSGAKFSMPGMMDTVLNLGLSDRSVKGLAKQTGDDRFAYDSYRRFISMYGRIVLDIAAVEFDEPFEKAKAASGVKSDAEIPAKVLAELCDEYKDVVKKATGKPFRDRGGVPQLEWCACDRVPRPRAHQPRARHSGERAGDGLRQPRRQLRHRSWLHAQRGHRREQALRRLPRERAG